MVGQFTCYQVPERSTKQTECARFHTPIQPMVVKTKKVQKLPPQVETWKGSLCRNEDQMREPSFRFKVPKGELGSHNTGSTVPILLDPSQKVSTVYTEGINM